MLNSQQNSHNKYLSAEIQNQSEKTPVNSSKNVLLDGTMVLLEHEINVDCCNPNIDCEKNLSVFEDNPCSEILQSKYNHQL